MTIDYHISHIPLYNQAALDDELTQKLFILRQEQFNGIISDIGKNQLIIGSSGMGKSSLLKKLEVELRENKNYSSRFIPLLLSSEHYNLKSSEDIWKSAYSELKEYAGRISERERKDLTELIKKEGSEYDTMLNFATTMNRDIVLLLDNIEMIQSKCGEEDFLKFLSMADYYKNVHIIASSDFLRDLPKNPYSQFDIKYLGRPNFEEFVKIMLNLTAITRYLTVSSEIKANISYIMSLYILSGGTPRSAVILFRSIVKGFPEDVFDLLNNLLDELSPRFRAIFDSLSNQMQVILDAIGLHWAPMTIEQLRDITGYENQQLSPQLKRLGDMGIIEKKDAYKAKGGAYQFSDRLFNLWLIVNSGNKAQRDKVVYLTRFLENFYKDRIPESARKYLEIESTPLSRITEQIAFVKSLKEHNRLRKEGEQGSPENLMASELNNYWLQKAVSQLMEDNFGMADESLSRALTDLSGSFQSYEKEDWWRFSKIVLQSGNGEWLLKILKKNNIDSTMSPYYAAIESFTSDNPEKYFDSIPTEMKETAKELREIISY